MRIDIYQREVTKMYQRFFTNYLEKKFRTYVSSKSGKPLKNIIKRTSKADLHPVSFWYQVKSLYRAERKARLDVRVKARLRLKLHIHTDN